MSTVWERAQSTLVTLAAVAVAIALLHREFGSSSSAGSGDERKSERVEGWQNIVPAGRVLANPAANVKLIEFADLECPFCRQFNTTMRAVAQRYPKDVSIVFVHLPLSMHRFARPAARAAECAATQGRFPQMVDQLYGGQDSYGLKPWTAFALRAGVGDTVAFAQCMLDTMPVAAVNRGVAVAQKLGIRSTPTVLVNDLKFGSPPEVSELFRVIDSALKTGQR